MTYPSRNMRENEKMSFPFSESGSKFSLIMKNCDGEVTLRVINEKSSTFLSFFQKCTLLNSSDVSLKSGKY